MSLSYKISEGRTFQKRLGGKSELEHARSSEQASMVPGE
jgi:hypothetical protein